MRAILVFAIFLSILILSASPAYGGDPLSACTALLNCPRYMGDKHWGDITKKCCQGHPNTAFHCQEKDGRVITACVEPITCEAGSFPKLKGGQGGGSEVTLTCTTCEDGYFQNHPARSIEYQHPHCGAPKQQCSPEHDGKRLVSREGPASDDRCRCSWEDGWIPHGSNPQCKDPRGFVAADGCVCERHDCPDGVQLDHEYHCVPASAKTKEETENSGQPKRIRKWVPEEGFPGGLPKGHLHVVEHPREQRDRNGFYVLLIIPLGVAVVGVILVICCCCVDNEKKD